MYWDAIRGGRLSYLKIGRLPFRVDSLFVLDNVILALSVPILSIVSTLFTYASNGPSIIYIPLGVAFAFLLSKGDSRWPGLLVGFLLDYFLFTPDGATDVTIILGSLGSTISVLVGVRMVRRYSNRNNPFSTLWGLWPVLLAMGAVVPVLATMSKILMIYMEGGSLDDLTYVVASLFMGNCLGTVILFPMLTAMDLYHKKLDSNLDPLPAVIVLMFVAIIASYVLRQFTTDNTDLALVLSILIVPLVFLSVNYGGLFAGSASIFFMAIGMVNAYGPSATSSLAAEFWSTLIIQTHLIMLTIVCCLYYSIVRESKDNLMEVNHRVRNNLLLVISLIKLQASGRRSEASRQALDEIENRLIVISTVCDAQHESGYGTANFKKIMDVLISKMSDWPMVTGEGWDLELEIEKANLAALIVNEVATGAFRKRAPCRISIDMEQHKNDVTMTIDLMKGTRIISLSDCDLMMLRQILMRHPRTEIGIDGCILRIKLPEPENMNGKKIARGLIR